MKIRLLISIVVILFMLSCKKDEKENLSIQDYDYIPMEIGSWKIYDVDSTVYDDFLDTSYTQKYQIKEVVESKFIDAEGKEAYRIERYFRADENQQWKISDVWFANIDSKSYQKVEENIRYVKLIFPIKLNAKWNGNAYNTYEDENYTYIKVNSPYQINSKLYDSTLMVQQKNDINLLTEVDKYEVYAKKIGLVEKYNKNITKNIVTGEIVKGTILEYKLLSHGK